MINIEGEADLSGAIDQVGNVLAIGGVNEKIEGFYDTCQDLGLIGGQGVIIPKANEGTRTPAASPIPAGSSSP